MTDSAQASLQGPYIVEPERETIRANCEACGRFYMTEIMWDFERTDWDFARHLCDKCDPGTPDGSSFRTSHHKDVG